MKIGIGITTHNRYEVFKESFEEIKKYSPKDAKIVVIDDASDLPIKEATFRFDKNVGIAKAKNKCFELLDDCDHIFLFDDDTYCISENWHLPYINSKEPHLMYIFQDFSTEKNLNDNVLIFEDSKLKAYSHSRGCMLYFDREVLKKVGGMNPLFGKWGWEHPELSDRIYNNGLTTFKYADVVGSDKLIYSLDEHQKVKSTVFGTDRKEQIKKNDALYRSLKDSKDFVPYKDGSSKTAFITTYFTSVKDPQRNTHFEADESKLDALIDNIPEDVQLIVLTDAFEGFDENVFYIKTEASHNPYFQRWISIYQFLQERHYDTVFCIDATDVEVLKNPFNYIQENTLYVGYEPTTLGSDWMRQNHKARFLQNFFKDYSNMTLVNAGIIGGQTDIVKEFIRIFLDHYFTNYANVAFKKDLSVGEKGDMGLFNFVAYTYFNDKLMYGREVCTSFKAFENNKISWFKHK
ncbi:glycosyltransferase family 2 protein [Joostella sp.]|uniref:glycosyltransferase family 2 protein n=1 Tax=Joostella sp. TaxID=2231138 RepID=UPI003A8FA969